MNEHNDSYLVIDGASETQGTELSTLTEDTAFLLSPPPTNYSTSTTTTSSKRSATSTTATPLVKSRRVGLSTTIKPLSTGQFISNDDKKTQYSQFVRTPNADAIKVYNLTAPPPSYKGENWKYFHLVGYYKDSPKESHNHSVDCEYACCNICSAIVICKKAPRRGAVMKHTGGGLKYHIESVHKIYKEDNQSNSNIITIPEQFQRQDVPKYLNKEQKQEKINDATLKWIIKECLPMDTTESISFQSMMKAAYVGYKNISSKHIKTKLYQMAIKVRRQIKKLVGNNTVSMTSDHWTSLAKQNYEGMTIHWIDNEWKLHSLPCGCFLHEGDSKSTSLSESFFSNIFQGLG